MRYFFATETTSLEFFSMGFWRAFLSPTLALFERSISSACVRRSACPMCLRYFAKSSGVSSGVIFRAAPADRPFGMFCAVVQPPLPGEVRPSEGPLLAQSGPKLAARTGAPQASGP